MPKRWPSLAFWRYARRTCQSVSLIALLALVAYTTRDVRGILSARDLMGLDPLAGLAATVASRRWLAHFTPALVLLLSSLALGRFWCGWLCPLGTLLDWISPRSASRKQVPPGWRRVKYGLLSLIVFAALWGNLTLLILDPLTLFVRSVATLLLPALQWLVMALESVLYRVTLLGDALDAVDTALQGPILSYKQPLYQGVLLTAGLLVGILALNWLSSRFWCRYLCPLGGLLSLVSRFSWLKRHVATSCIQCGRCASDCRMGTIDAAKEFASDSGECILCLDCAVGCPTGAITFQGQVAQSRPGDGPTRRQLLQAFAWSIGGLVLSRVAVNRHHPNLPRLRPPGALEDQLLSACIRCGACLRACPTHGLQPALMEAGLDGLFTPVLQPRLGPCDYSCTACGEVCPTGAIPALSLAAKRLTPIGKAYIDPVRCIAWSERGPCIVCEEVCPLPDKAITLLEKQVQGSGGMSYTLQVPVVSHERCIGCGLCEQKCPVNGEAAIRVIIDPLA